MFRQILCIGRPSPGQFAQPVHERNRGRPNEDRPVNYPPAGRALAVQDGSGKGRVCPLPAIIAGQGAPYFRNKRGGTEEGPSASYAINVKKPKLPIAWAQVAQPLP